MNNDSLQTWFGLSYASWLTIPRVLMQEMPDEWQEKMAELLFQYDEAMANIHSDYEGLTIHVSLKKDGRFCRIPSELTNYRRPSQKFNGRVLTQTKEVEK